MKGDTVSFHTPPPFGHLLYLRGGAPIRFSIMTNINYKKERGI